MNLQLLETFARRHHGLVTLAAVLASRQSRRAWYRALESGLLVLIHAGVARVATSPTTRLQVIHAAVLAAGPGAHASHRTACELWGIPRPVTDPIDVMTSARGRHLKHLDGVVMHRPRDLVDIVPVRRHGIPTSKLLRCLTDLGAVDADSVHAAVGHVLSNRLASGSALHWATRAHSRKGRHGVVALRSALEDWLLDGQLLDSDLEIEMKKLRARFPLPPMTFHATCAGYEVDFLIDGTNIVVECDSLEFHDKRRDDFERDRKKKADLAAAGYVVVPITWRQITRQPKWVVAVITKAVSQPDASGRAS